MNDQKLFKIATECLAENYDIEGTLSRLPGENLNLLVTASDSTKHVFKIVDEHMLLAVVRMQNAAIEHAVAAGFKPRLPRISENRKGNIDTRIILHKNGSFRAILMEFIPGIELSNLTDISENLLFDLGKTVADFDIAMQRFVHPAASRSHLWNLAEVEQHEAGIRLIAEREKRDLLGWSFSIWRQAREALASVPWQVVHGDIHDENVLVEGEKVSGLVDFGDCCFNPTVCDLAICLAYLMMRGDNPLRFGRIILEGYHGVRPLSQDEFALLYPLVCARLAVSVCVANRRKTIDPDNPNWFGGEPATWRMLRRLQVMGPNEFGSGLGRFRPLPSV